MNNEELATEIRHKSILLQMLLWQLFALSPALREEKNSKPSFDRTNDLLDEAIGEILWIGEMHGLIPCKMEEV